MHDPLPNAWKPATLVLTPAADGHAGTLTLDGVAIHIRRWRMVAGAVQFEHQHESDGWLEREFPR